MSKNMAINSSFQLQIRAIRVGRYCSMGHQKTGFCFVTCTWNMHFRSYAVQSCTQSEEQITGSNSLWSTYRVIDRYKIQDEFGPYKIVTFTNLGLSNYAVSI